MLLGIQVIEIVCLLSTYYFHHNVGLLSFVLPSENEVWGVPRWRFLVLLGLVSLLITLIGLAGASMRRVNIAIAFFFLSPVRLMLVCVLLQPPLSLACGCQHQSYAQCAALHSFEDKERKFDDVEQDAFHPDVPERFIQTLDFPMAVDYSPAESLIEQNSLAAVSRGNHHAMPKRALGPAILQSGTQEVGADTKLEPADSNLRHTFVPGSTQQGWVHPPMGASETEISPHVQWNGSQVEGLDCAGILARMRSSLLEEPTSAGVARPDLLTPQQRRMYRRVQHVLELKKTATDSEEDLCRDLQNVEDSPSTPVTPDVASVAKDDELKQWRQTSGGILRPHVALLEDVGEAKRRTDLFIAEACRCAYPSCMRADEEGKGHWCYVEESTIPDCKAKDIVLSKDPDSGKPWTKDLCREPCECMGTGLKPPGLEVPVPATMKEQTDANPYFYGSKCARWDNHEAHLDDDPMEWCYVGLDTTCAWRDKAMVPHDLYAKWYYKSWVACRQGDVGLKESCRMAQFRCLFLAIVDFASFWSLMLLLYFFIGTQCGDFVEAEQDFVADDSESEDDFDYDANHGDKACEAKEANNAEESVNQEDDEDEDEDDDADADREASRSRFIRCLLYVYIYIYINTRRKERSPRRIE